MKNHHDDIFLKMKAFYHQFRVSLPTVTLNSIILVAPEFLKNFTLEFLDRFPKNSIKMSVF